jgi:hypothetical protein
MSLSKIIQSKLRESVYYHGTVLPNTNPTIDKFKATTGYRFNPFIGTQREVKSPWTFFTNDYDLAQRYGASKAEGMYYDKRDFSHKHVVLKYEINESDLNILDLTTDDYETVLEKIGIKLWDIYGMGMYEQEQMWRLLDDEELSDKILKAGFDAVKLFESPTGEMGTSLAIHLDIVNDVIKQIP